jgi:Zn-dependent protease with chaperone function/TPR repeat protein
MRSLTKLFFLLCLVTPSSWAEVWDLRAISNSPNNYTSLVKQNKAVFSTLSVNEAKMVRDIVDKFSLLSGVYPRIVLNESSELNASAGYIENTPTLIINKSMFDVIVKDEGMAAALIGHEMSHLYYRHGESKKDIQAAGQMIGLLAGVVLEVATQRKTGVTNVGANVGMALGTAYSTSFSRDHEREADRQGIEWAIKAGYDPYGASRLFEMFERQSGNVAFPFFQTHPNPSERIESSKQLATNLIQRGTVTASVTIAPELEALNKLIDEARAKELPQTTLGKQGIDAYKSGDFVLARQKFDSCDGADTGMCKNNLGLLYRKGIGGDVDRQKAFSLFKTASEFGSLYGKTNYANMVGSGEATGSIETEEMLKLTIEAASAGSPFAMGTIAYLEQFKSIGRFKINHPSKDELVNFAKASSMRGVTDGSLALGSYYRNGFGVEKNLQLAEQYLKNGSNSNDSRADAELLMLYLDDLNDKPKAEFARNRIVTKKSIPAAGILTESYCSGNIFTRNSKECFEWSSFGAINGSPVISRVYGFVLFTGVGTTKNKPEGLAWVLSAKMRGDKGAIQLAEKYSSEFTHDELFGIESRARQIIGTFGAKN